RRLCSVHSDGSDPLLVEPGAQWLLDGVDVLAAMAPAPAAAAPEIVDVTGAVIEVASGSIVLGSVRQLTAADRAELVLATQTFENHEVAGINCRFTLPVVSVDDVLALHARIVARVTRADVDTALRSSLHNPVAARFDTVAEIVAPGTGARTLEFATQSLAHVSLERQGAGPLLGGEVR